MSCDQCPKTVPVLGEFETPEDVSAVGKMKAKKPFKKFAVPKRIPITSKFKTPKAVENTCACDCPSDGDDADD